MAVNAEALKGWSDIGEMTIDWDKYDPEKPAAAYVFAFRLTGGFTKVCCWTKERVQAHAKRYSQSFRSGGESPWSTNFDSMALKTVISNELRKWGILSIQMQKALTVDQAIITDVDATPEFPDKEIEDKKPDFTPRGPQKQLNENTPEKEDGDLGPVPGAAQSVIQTADSGAGVTVVASAKVEETTKVEDKPVSVADPADKREATVDAGPQPRPMAEPKRSEGSAAVDGQLPLAAPKGEAAARPKPQVSPPDDHSKNVAAMQKHLDEAKLTPAELIAWAVGCGILKGTPPESLATIPAGKLNILLHQPKQTIKATADWKSKHPQA